MQRYATACVAAAQRAEYDAAVLAQLRGIGLEDEDAVAFIALSLRPDRPPLDDVATAPMTLVPGINAAGKPFIGLLLDGEQVGQLDTEPLRTHAMHVLETPAAVDLDAGLLQALLTMGIEEPKARNVVADIANWRT